MSNEIEVFLQKYKNLPEQGSQEWIEKRKYAIGGSEFAMIVNNKLADLISLKTNLSKIPDLLVMRWGNIFEELARHIAEHVFLCDIYEAGSIPSVHSDKKNYSMDGAGIVHFKDGKRVILFEFKCLYSRIPEHGKVYENYLPQILSGLSDIPIFDQCVYIEHVFRLCPMKNLSLEDKTMNEYFHSVKVDDYPFACGLMGIYYDCKKQIPELNDYEESYLDRLNNVSYIDFGSMRTKDDIGMFSFVTKMMKNKYFNTWLSPMELDAKKFTDEIEFIDENFKFRDLVTDHKKNLKQFKKWCDRKDYKCIGYIPWKLYDYNAVIVDKVPDYTLKYIDKIEKCMSIVESLNKISDIDERERKFREISPSLKI